MNNDMLDAINARTDQFPHLFYSVVEGPSPRHRSLPAGGQSNGRPVWEPPIFDYSSYSGEGYEKEREAMLQYYNGDVTKTTTHMDKLDAVGLLLDYWRWVCVEFKRADKDNKPEETLFWSQLRQEVAQEYYDARNEPPRLDILYFEAAQDGTLVARNTGDLIGRLEVVAPRASGSWVQRTQSGEKRKAHPSPAQEARIPDTASAVQTAPLRPVLTIVESSEEPASLPSQDTPIPTTISAASQTVPPLTIPTDAMSNNEPPSPPSPRFRCGCSCS